MGMKLPDSKHCDNCSNRQNTVSLPHFEDKDKKPKITGDLYCERCGGELHKTCPTCYGSGFSLSRYISSYCTKCGQPIYKQSKSICLDCHGSGKVRDDSHNVCVFVRNSAKSRYY